jgi:hypothetical protein
MPAKKIVYLFGAGATHAEIMNLENSPNATYREKYGLLISNVSKRVMNKAQRKVWFKNEEHILASKQGSLNIELFISLLESNNMPIDKINYLKNLVENDIENILNERKTQFYLHKALLELHNLVEDQEELLGLISVNYDVILDEAYEYLLKYDREYCFTSECSDRIPLLKLHGSFNWKNISIYNRAVTIPIIPLGINKNYLTPPYNFIWGQAYELLVNCDILRVIGCSLNQNDIGLIDLLFKAHNQRRSSIEIQIIDFQPLSGHHQIKNNYGFFPNIVEPKDLEGTLISDQAISDTNNGNPFKIWLKAKALKMIEGSIPKTEYLNKIFIA